MLNVFVSYAHADEQYKDEFRKHAAALRRNKIISLWNDREIVAGQEWESEITENLEQADIILLLISPDFLDSDFCYDIEMERAVQRHDEGSATVVPIILKDCDWAETPFAKIQGVPKDAKAVVTWSDRDTAWLDAIRSIKKAIEEHKKKFQQSLPHHRATKI
ncbi:toll/interleukin-1 receptor domain-containing protein [Endozoicomonas numazuensis]|uniref:toll/interleukin-1 receptor domain-containing protein n=1 Tax=Endozoicomonas numazuensis TaxID=1137799 RepID=UPI00068D1568|nr:toll/interleukin-1 receptor domain-containing protein [Endozoicomonas numazuensis]